MRTALISDIHGNYDGLQAVLADIERQECDRILCLGDLVDGGAQSIEVVQLFQQRAIPVVQGNHDEYPDAALPPDVRKYLSDLPEAIVEGQTIYTHTSPRQRKTKIVDSIEAWNVFEEVPYRRIFVGDLHVPLIFGQQCPDKVSAASYPSPTTSSFSLRPMTATLSAWGPLGIAAMPTTGCAMRFTTANRTL